ncbi:hypothetical protein BWR17_19025 (plasmid) [Phaeobacter inhibens]|nr:hypothetical protein BWR17_19025 [Phaeobacter inhibens]
MHSVGLSPDEWHILFQALIEAESAYNPTAVSPKGAYEETRRLPFGLYASENYLARLGTPTKLGDLKSHALIGYVDDLIYTPELSHASKFIRGWRSDIEVSTAIAQVEADRSGVCIGICHDVMAVGTSNLVRLFPDQSVTRSYWLVWHENQAVARRVRAVVDLLEQILREDRGMFLPASET